MNSKKQRKFRIWDSKLLTQMCEVAMEIKDGIEQALPPGAGPEHLKVTAISTATLYDLVSCYEAMYESLLNEELITHGYPTQTNRTH